MRSVITNVIVILLAAGFVMIDAGAEQSVTQVPGQVLLNPPAKTETPPDTAAPGGDPNLVWVDKDSHLYLCPTDDWYGKTRNGEYMSEWNAKALGYHAKDDKECGP